MRAPLRRVGLRAEGLDIGWPERPVLSGLDFELRSGEVLALLGPNGAGKTTLIRSLAGELPPLGGRVLVEGEGVEGRSLPLASLSSIQRARLLARVLQNEDPAWPLSLRSYVESGTFSATGWFGAPTKTERAAVEEALEILRLRDLAERPVTELSGGEFRRVLLARALAQRPSILLLDEPSSDLDLAWQVDILGILRDLAASGLAVALSLHDLNLAAMAADRVGLLAEGGLLALGSPREVITAAMVSRAYGAPVLVADHPLGDFPHLIHAPAWLGGRAAKEGCDD